MTAFVYEVVETLGGARLRARPNRPMTREEWVTDLLRRGEALLRDRRLALPVTFAAITHPDRWRARRVPDDTQ